MKTTTEAVELLSIADQSIWSRRDADKAEDRDDPVSSLNRACEGRAMDGDTDITLTVRGTDDDCGTVTVEGMIPRSRSMACCGTARIAALINDDDDNDDDDDDDSEDDDWDHDDSDRCVSGVADRRTDEIMRKLKCTTVEGCWPGTIVEVTRSPSESNTVITLALNATVSFTLRLVDDCCWVDDVDMMEFKATVSPLNASDDELLTVTH